MPLRHLLGPPPARHSLKWRVPVAIASVIGIVLFSFVWVGQAIVERTLVEAGSTRLTTAAGVLARLLDRTAALAQVSKAGNAPELQAYLRQPSAGTEEPAREALRMLAVPSARRVELWDATGKRVLEFTRSTPPDVPPIDHVPAAGVTPLQVTRGVVHYDLVAPVGNGLGHIVIRTAVVPVNPESVSRLLGQYADALIGNRDGTVWFDLTKPVAGPAVRPDRDGKFEFVNETGERYIGAAAVVPGTPWVAWLQFPREQLVLPGAAFYKRMVPVAALFLLLGGILAWRITARFTRPIADLSAAAQAVAGGDYTRRLEVADRGEVGRLAQAFNVMTSMVEESQHRLEARVDARTAELATARVEADAANRAKSEFLSLMSHDLRTPLNAILGFAQLLESDRLTAEQADHVAHILNGGRHLLALISDVLDITRIESGQIGLTVEPVAVRELVLSAVDLVRPLAQQRGITMQVGSGVENVAVRADAQRFNQILLNLLSNAVKYNRPQGSVTVSGARVEGDRYRISVADTGVGLTASQVARLFQPFERLGAEQTSVEGTGLGLALSRALAEGMGGSLGVESAAGIGSTFWVELPETEMPAATQPVLTQPAEVPALPPTDGGVVLYVEDNLSNVRLLQRILQRRPGVELIHAATGEAGLALARARRPGLVFLDLHLPDRAGEQVLRELATDPRTSTIPKVIVTADATPGLAQRLEADGAVRCLTKPLHIASVLRLVDRLLKPSAETFAHG